MTITELIAALEAIRAEHGDLEVVAYRISYDGGPAETLADGDVYRSGDRVVISP